MKCISIDAEIFLKFFDTELIIEIVFLAEKSEFEILNRRFFCRFYFFSFNFDNNSA